MTIQNTDDIAAKFMEISKGERNKFAQEGGVDAGNNAHKEIIAELNERHAVVMLGGKCQILNEVINPVNDLPDVNFSSLFDFRSRYQNRKIPLMVNDQIKETCIADFWLDHPNRRAFQGIIFDPNCEENPGYYNLWKGFAVTAQKGNWSKMQAHIIENICSSDTEVFQYLLAWMARLAQQPGGKRPGVVVVLRGRQGVGKGVFITNFGKIFGQHYKHIFNPHIVAGRFNNIFKDCLLAFIDEGFWAGNKAAESILKGMVTESVLYIEPKGKETFPVRNHANFIFASNSDWIVPASSEERRFFVIDVSDAKMQESGYFGEIQNEMDNGGREAMLYDLLRLNITGFDFRKFPRRQALFDQILLSWPTENKFWYECLRTGNIGSATFASQWPDRIETERLHDLYVEYAKIAGDRNRLDDAVFGRNIKKLCPAIVRKQLRGDNGKRYYYILPSLDKCRNDLSTLLQMKVNWDDDNEI